MPSAIDYHDRCAAFLDRQQRAARADRIPVLAVPAEPDSVRDTGRRSRGQHELKGDLDAWVRRHRPEVILAFNNAFYWWLRQAGWRVPDDVAFIDLWIVNPDSQPLWPGLVLQTDEIGRRAIDWLDGLLRAGERGIPQNPATMLIDMRWQTGKPDTAPPVGRGLKPGIRTRR